MKANKFFLGLALIGAILTGCDNGQEPETPKGNGIEADAYVSVKISMASTVGTRATDGGFEEGDIDEQVIGANSIFLFYDKDGNWVTSGQLVTSYDLDKEEHLINGGKDALNSSYGDTYIVLSGPDEELKKSRQVLTVVNYSGYETLKQLNLSEALAKVTTETSDTAINFLMSTSVYVGRNKANTADSIISTTAITADNIQSKMGDAKGNPVKIYIERAAAKATLSLGKNDVKLDSAVVVDGQIKAVTVTINTWNLNNVYKSTYLVKQLDKNWIGTDTLFNAWNWKEAYRCYWAQSHHWTGDPKGATQIRSYAEATLNVGQHAYCYENTVGLPKCGKGEANPNVNTVLIAAQFKVEGAADYQNLYRYSGVFYTENTYKNLILKQIQDKGYKKDGDIAYTTDDLTISPKGSSIAEIKFVIAEASTTQKIIIDGTEKDVVTFVNELAYVTQTVGYADGKCYYQIPVEHLGTIGCTKYGMVRNHWYQIKVNAIKRIGEPVFDENVDIPSIPEETTEHYLAAEIHVLSWHVVNQNVEL